MHPDRQSRLPGLAVEPADTAPATKFPKKALFEDDDSDSDDGGAAVKANGDFKVNEDFAKRFEHNKKREEKHRLEEKFKREGRDASGSESESTDESEDEDAFLATEDLDARISETLNALRSKDPASTTRQPSSSPKSILAEINAAATNGDASGDEEDGFLKTKSKSKSKSDDVSDEEGATKQGDKKKQKQKKKSKSASAAVITEADIQAAERDPELYLSNFMAARAWVGPDGSNWKAFESDENGDSDLEKADEIEAAYNMRFEDPTKSNEVLRSYARDVAAEKSVRREKMSARQRQRETERERKEEEKRERKEEKARLRRLKMDEAQAKLERIKEAAGVGGQDLSDDQLLQILNDAWDDDRWEDEMKKRFGESYYEKDDVSLSSGSEAESGDDGEQKKKKKKKKPKKPTWDDDIDITDFVKDYQEDDAAPAFSLSDVEEQQDDDDEEMADAGSDEDEDDDRVAAKRAAKQERTRLEALVSAKLDIEDPDHLAARSARSASGSSSKAAPSSAGAKPPRAFGMTARDILLAPSDKALNQFAGIKKYASFRDPEQKRKEKKSLSKKARLKKWRRDVFGREYEETGPSFGFEALENVEADAEEIRVPRKRNDGAAAAAADRDGDDDADKEKKKKKRKRSHKKSGEMRSGSAQTCHPATKHARQRIEVAHGHAEVVSELGRLHIKRHKPRRRRFLPEPSHCFDSLPGRSGAAESAIQVQPARDAAAGG
ncbi:unnamed protein product [Parascedosporium putredinis]|uniref:Kri1-like C-terminal domain-containing protein n=1 Tax=Parascedosporium putredinis TaxID=1442378 RepID=A0A9P1HA48_9PEZI|nr:unnamed protein product [Parascedosporium putredinis]CAI8002448.1 unnamed protein product [Parascedosporium putredinis]